MNPAAHRNEDTASALVLYMMIELNNKISRLGLSDGVKRSQVYAGHSGSQRIGALLRHAVLP